MKPGVKSQVRKVFMNILFILSLAAMELIICIADFMVLHFGFVTKTELKHSYCFNYC